MVNMRSKCCLYAKEARLTVYSQQFLYYIPLTCTRNVRSLNICSVVTIEAGALSTVGLHTVTVGRTGHT